MKKRIKTINILSPDIFFYTIPLENSELILKKEVLNKHYEPLPKGRNAHMGIHESYVSYANEIFKIAVYLVNVEVKHIYLHINIDEIQVACECGMPGGKLCAHAYFGLHRILWYREEISLKTYYWPGITAEEKGKNKFLDIKLGDYHILIEPKKEYGAIYRTGLGFDGADKLKLEKQEDNPAALTAGSRLVLGYALVYDSLFYASAHLPFLLPFIAETNKKGDQIAYYKNYLHRDQSAPIKLTHDQIILNEMCFDMYDIAVGVGRLPDSRRFEQWQDVIPTMIDLWRKVIPKLQYQTYVKSTLSFGYKNWTKRPRKLDTRNCRIQADNLLITFLLKEHEDHYTLELVTKLRYGTLSSKHRKVPLFIHDQGIDWFYLVTSQQDDKLLNWLDESSNKLTILKTHFAEFQITFLNQLSKIYQVIFKHKESRKLTTYDAGFKRG